MSSEAHNSIEEDTKIENETVTPEVVDTPQEGSIKNETGEDDNINEKPEFKNKTDMVKHKKVTCKDCNAEMTLKTLRYSHKCSGTLESKPIKPKPKVKVKPIAISPPEDHQNEPALQKQATQPKPIPSPQKNTSPISSPYDNLSQAQLYQLHMRTMNQEIMRRRQEKANNMCQAMFKPKSKKSR